MSALLEVRGLDVFYGEAQALDSVTFDIGRQEIVAIIGANGAGKTTLLRTISGLVRGRKGSIHFNGREISSTPVHQVVAAGLAHIPEGRGIFPTLSVWENLKMGAYAGGRPDNAQLARVREWFPVLFERLSQAAGMLSGGEQQMLAIGRSLLARPKLVMIDELSLGLSPKITRELMPRLQEMRGAGTSVLLVDQSVALALRLADRVFILANGRVAWSGAPAELEGDPRLMNKYLGMD